VATPHQTCGVFVASVVVVAAVDGSDVLSEGSTAVTVYWALQELGIPYDLVEIDLKARDQDKRGYRQLNPNGKVPLVVHDGIPIFESAAIITVLVLLGQVLELRARSRTGSAIRALTWPAWMSDM